jgi:peptidoglycan/xylan/chitin deacetylase (PgdA/CDA1 family)
MDHKYKHILVCIVVGSGLVPLVRSWEAQRGNLLRVLAYHRIGDPGAESGLLDPDLLSATPELFEQQMHFLADNYRLISILDLFQAIETQEPLPPQSVLVTFDDGYHDFVSVAWPILEYYHVPTILFLPTGPLLSANDLFWWDRLFQGLFTTRSLRLNLPGTGDLPLGTKNQRLKAFTQLKRRIRSLDYHAAMSLVDTVLQELEVIPQTSNLMLNWSEVRFLNSHGCYLCAHTRQHSCLSRIPINDARQDIRDGKMDQLAEIGTIWPIFAYPYGEPCDLCEDLQPILQEEGFKLAVTTIPGINDWAHIDLLRIKRICPSVRHTMAEFQLSLTEIYNFYTVLSGRRKKVEDRSDNNAY